MFIFSEEKRRQLQEERPELSESELTRLLARMWNDLSEKKKVRLPQPGVAARARFFPPPLRPQGLAALSLGLCEPHVCARLGCWGWELSKPEGGKLSAEGPGSPGSRAGWRAEPQAGDSCTSPRLRQPRPGGGGGAFQRWTGYARPLQAAGRLTPLPSLRRPSTRPGRRR